MSKLVCADCGTETEGDGIAFCRCVCGSTRIVTVKFAEQHFGPDWREKCFGKRKNQ